MKIIYYSELLNKQFSSPEELTAAEDQYKKLQAEKKEKSQDKKAAAKNVENAFNNLLEAKRKAKDVVQKATRDANAILKAAEENYEKELTKFLEKYPEGFHMTLTNAEDASRFIEDQVVKMFNDFLKF